MVMGMVMAIGMVAFIFVFEPTGNVALAVIAALMAGVDAKTLGF